MSTGTTAFINNQHQTYQTLEKCHDGEGPLMLKDVIGAFGKWQFIKFIHDDIIPPGTTIGYHQHACSSPFEEWYYVLSGEGIMQLDGEDHRMRPGDISVCFANGHHGIKNTGTENLRILVICAAPL